MKLGWYYPLVRLSARAMLLLTKVEVSGKKNMPQGVPLVICANHISSADPPILGLHLPRYGVYFLAKKELFVNRTFGKILKESGAIPLNRDGASGTSFKASARVIKKGGALIIFPEGKRNPDGGLTAAMPGAGYLAAAFKTPVIPVAITGTETITGKWWFLKRHRVKIVIGKPFNMTITESKPDKDALAAYGDQIMRAIAELLPPKYRGIYGERQS
ncbi:MAG: lysophospholipid acyltransferase family protein [Dehalogenimonas sp.]